MFFLNPNTFGIIDQAIKLYMRMEIRYEILIKHNSSKNLENLTSNLTYINRYLPTVLSDFYTTL